jgi:hypothetical protein
MKLILRILLILLSISLWVVVFLPPSPSELPATASGPEDAITPTTTPAPAHSLVSDLLGAKQIRAGQKAREQLDKVKAQRDATMQELE